MEAIYWHSTYTITSELTPVTNMEIIPVVTAPAPSEMEQIMPTHSIPVPLVEAQMQPKLTTGWVALTSRNHRLHK